MGTVFTCCSDSHHIPTEHVRPEDAKNDKDDICEFNDMELNDEDQQFIYENAEDKKKDQDQTQINELKRIKVKNLKDEGSQITIGKNNTYYYTLAKSNDCIEMKYTHQANDKNVDKRQALINAVLGLFNNFSQLQQANIVANTKLIHSMTERKLRVVLENAVFQLNFFRLANTGQIGYSTSRLELEFGSIELTQSIIGFLTDNFKALKLQYYDNTGKLMIDKLNNYNESSLIKASMMAEGIAQESIKCKEGLSFEDLVTLRLNTVGLPTLTTSIIPQENLGLANYNPNQERRKSRLVSIIKPNGQRFTMVRNLDNSIYDLYTNNNLEVLHTEDLIQYGNIFDDDIDEVKFNEILDRRDQDLLQKIQQQKMSKTDCSDLADDAIKEDSENENSEPY